VFAENDIKFDHWLPEIYRCLKLQTHAYIMINGRNVKDLQICAERAGFKYQNLLIWNKGNKTPNRFYMQQCEFILLLAKSPALSINDMGCANFFEIKNRIGKKIHPTEKPVSLMEIFVKNSSQKGHTILDPFMGSGSTAIACANTGRHFIGIEKDENYYIVAKQRLIDHLNKIKGRRNLI
jgi:site-specific DNA-methyltransferase (adenine-specific)